MIAGNTFHGTALKALGVAETTTSVMITAILFDETARSCGAATQTTATCGHRKVFSGSDDSISYLWDYRGRTFSGIAASSSIVKAAGTSLPGSLDVFITSWAAPEHHVCEHYVWGGCTIVSLIARRTSASSEVAPAFRQQLFCGSTPRVL